MSFCRITGRSRNLPKANYFPLGGPLSPAEAARCRVTGKSFGLPAHHYVPVLLRRATTITRCRITKVADLYGRRHHPLVGFRYLRPVLANQPLLAGLLGKQSGRGQFVYTVKERRCSFVFPVQLELAVRAGDISDVLLSRDADRLLFKMKEGANVSLDVTEINEEEYMEDEELFEGEGLGPEETKVVKKKQKFTMGLAKIFEDKEKQAIDEEIVVHKKKSRKENKTSLVVNGEDWRNLIQPLIESWDWDTFEQEVVKGMPGTKWTPSMNGVSSSITASPLSVTPFQIIQDALCKLTPVQLEQTESIFQKLINGGKRILENLPLVNEIQEVVRKLSTGTLSELVTIPGMNVFTEKSRFIIGQMMQTARGNIFVPGQTVAGEQGNSFLPGFIVNTANGPALIPGLILSKQKHSAVFMPGQNILSENNKYEFMPGQNLIMCEQLDIVEVIAPEPEPVLEGWEVRTQNGTEYLERCHEPTIDAEEKLQNELNEIETLLLSTPVESTPENVISDVAPEVVNNIDSFNTFIASIEGESGLQLTLAKEVAESYYFNNDEVENASKIILAIAHFAQNIYTQSTVRDVELVSEMSLLNNTDKYYIILKNALVTAASILQANRVDKQEAVLNAVGEIFASLDQKDVVLAELCEMLNSSVKCRQIFGEIIEENNHWFPKVSKLDILKSALNPRTGDDLVVEKLSVIIEEDLIAPAFKNVSEDNPEFLSKVLKCLRGDIDEIRSDREVSEALQSAIVAATEEVAVQKLQRFLAHEDVNKVQELLQEAAGLATALGMDDAAMGLRAAAADPQSTQLVAGDALSLEILKRLTLMRQLATRQPAMAAALAALQRDPRGARADPRLRALVRESAALSASPRGQLNSSESIPCNLFHEHNVLAMEDFLTRHRHPGTLLISKRGLQAVVPKEASRAVLSGQVAYTLIDETGITHFQPMHAISALQLSKPTARRFSNYACLDAGRLVIPDQSPADKVNRLLACF